MFERRLESPAAIWGRYGAIVVFAGICLIPIWVMVGTSFKNEFILALLLTGRSTRTLPVGAAGFITDTGVEWGRIMAMGTLIAIPPLVFTFFAARQIIAGMTAGAVKG